MSWKYAGHLLSGPPSSSTPSNSGPSSIPKHLRPNTNGLNAFQRERQLSTHYKAFDGPAQIVRSEWDVLKENHRFIRDDEEPGEVSWKERLARAYESKLFKEFALIDLKHYKSHRLALRWRTAPEVVSGIGEDTCASLRCKYHDIHAQPTTPERVAFNTPESERNAENREKRRGKIPRLRAFELPFVYEEGGERKEALVKVRLCKRCAEKLCWKPGDERGGSGGRAEVDGEDDHEQKDEAEAEHDVNRSREGNRIGDGSGRETGSDGRRRHGAAEVGRQHRSEPRTRRDKMDRADARRNEDRHVFSKDDQHAWDDRTVHRPRSTSPRRRSRHAES